jgi:hypothetical protein
MIIKFEKFIDIKMKYICIKIKIRINKIIEKVKIEAYILK